MTGLKKDRLDPRDLLRELGKENPRDDLGHWGGHTRAEVMARARELMPDFPIITYPSGDPGKPKKNGVLVGVRLRYQDSNAGGNNDPGKNDPGNNDPGKNDPGKNDSGNGTGAGNGSRNWEEDPPKPKRTCAFCQTDISKTHPNTRKCLKCRHQRRTTNHIQEGRREDPNGRKCLDCPANISLMHHKSLRCEKCAPEHRLQYARKHGATPRGQ